ncbi:enoyl-CoA hydratase [Pusillimonas sp. TS35]|uniref:enoyl-CoA hydratase-related protein n=1 Tax=Paracandidimonas lactea TaxID=2895524 RepID=UPI00136950ED|nr:enoyl-CoA hydratase-related protein [Paracandidimonas lactea]MYN13886.1 enoyl-CoA hydratase [Pusillimonas sp. TS35]
MSDIGVLPDGIALHEVAPGILAVVFDRVAKRNAFSLNMWRGLGRVCKALAGRSSMRAVLVYGQGGHFCAGADISEFSTLRATPEQALQYQATVEQAIQALLDLPVPTIAAIGGVCVGGGVDVALACDIRIAQRDARFAVTPSRIGLVYSAWEARLLADAVGHAWAKRILFTGEILSSDMALRIGLVDELVESDAYSSALALAEATARNAPMSVRGAKLALRAAQCQSTAVDVERMSYAALHSDDYKEGVCAFMEKRSPNFVGC